MLRALSSNSPHILWLSTSLVPNNPHLSKSKDTDSLQEIRQGIRRLVDRSGYHGEHESSPESSGCFSSALKLGYTVALVFVGALKIAFLVLVGALKVAIVLVGALKETSAPTKTNMARLPLLPARRCN